MYIIDLTYKKPIRDVEMNLKEHIDFLNKYYEKGNFICSGRKNPRIGGVILCKANTLDEVNEIIQEDPFYIHQIANYDITEFVVSKSNKNLESFLREI